MIRDWDDRPPRRGAPAATAPILVAMLFAGLGIWSCWPGIAAFDTVRQYEQALSGHYDDWHPPVMAWLWARFLAMGWSGTAPLLVLQNGLYWGGIALLAAGLARSGARGAAWAALAAGLSPFAIDWMPVIVKDSQMLAALVAAVGLVARFRLTGRSLPWPVTLLVLLLLGYALLVRANAVFAVVPLAWSWAGWAGVRRWWLRGAMLLASMILALVAADGIDHRLIGADRSHVERVLPLFDLVGIASHARLAHPPGLTAEDWASAQRQHCYTPFYWDPFGDPKRCEDQGDAMVDDDEDQARPPIERVWLEQIAAHPLAYIAHRLAHLNATLRVRTPIDEPSAAAPAQSTANPDHLGAKLMPASRQLRSLILVLARSPLGSPAVWWVALLALTWVVSVCPAQPARDMALSLSFSASVMTASFAGISIASDLRYHLWLIASTGLVAVLLVACRDRPRQRLRGALAMIMVALLLSALLRAHAPPLPL